MAKKDRAQEIIDLIRKRTNLPAEQQGWISGPILTETQPPEPLSESRWADFSRNFVEEYDGEPIGASGYSTQAFFDKLVQLGEPDYEKPENPSRKLREMLKGLSKEREQEEKILEDLQKLDCFEAIRPEDLYE